MKKSTKALLTALCAVLLVVTSVMGTIAYLMDSEVVTNTMTVGKVGLSLDEAKVTEDGVQDGNTRVTANTYKLIPGKTYLKDPTVHVDANSEDAWIFVKVKNGIANIEGDTKIADQIKTTNGWTELEGVDDVYYKPYTKGDTEKDLKVFGSFTVAGTVDNDTLASYADKTITVTAYAVQKAGFDTAKAAWAATFGAPATNG